MHAAPLVSVVIPTWNRWPLLLETLESVRAQTYPAWELIVVDDGSEDGTPDRLAELGWPNLTVVETAHIGHLGRLRNLGVAQARGAFAAFVDSDDLWLPEKLAVQTAAMQRSGARWSYTGYTLFDETGADIPLKAGNARAVSGRIAAALLKDEIGVCVSTLMIERALYQSIGGFAEDQGFTNRGDVELSLRLARNWNVVGAPEPLARVREHSGRVTKRLKNPDEFMAMAHEIFLRSETDPELRALARRRLGGCFADAGARHLASGRVMRAATLFRRSFAFGGLDARNLRAAARGLKGAFAGGRPG
jgi:glycosyltransferase involved in cell wall biosynthesis